MIKMHQIFLSLFVSLSPLKMIKSFYHHQNRSSSSSLSSSILFVLSLSSFMLFQIGATDKSPTTMDKNNTKINLNISTTLNIPITTTTTTTATRASILVDASQISRAPGDPREIISYCNDPGRPPQSRISPVQQQYIDGEIVTYHCDEFISLKQYRRCVRGRWQGDTPICGAGLRTNDLVTVRYYDRDRDPISSDDENHDNSTQKPASPSPLSEYNLAGRLSAWTKFGNSFISERFPDPVRGSGAARYRVELTLQRPARLQMVRISFSLVNHMTDPVIRDSAFDIERITVSSHRDCARVANSSVSPWDTNSTRFDFWYFCRSRTAPDFWAEFEPITTGGSDLTGPSSTPPILGYRGRGSDRLLIETTARVSVAIDLATFIVAEPYTTNHSSRPDVICGLPEIPLGYESIVINDQSNYSFACSAGTFKRVDNFGGHTHIRRCGFDQRWHGELPRCAPARSCGKFSGINLRSASLVEVYKYDHVYYHDSDNNDNGGGADDRNRSDWSAIAGSRAFFRCKDDTHIFVGNGFRVCESDGEWSGSMPNCLVSAASEAPVSTNSILIAVLTTLIVTFLLSSCTIYFFFVKLKQKHTGSGEHHHHQQSPIEMHDATYYASSEMLDPMMMLNGKSFLDADETYEALDMQRYEAYHSPPQTAKVEMPPPQNSNHSGAILDLSSEPILLKTSTFDANRSNGFVPQSNMRGQSSSAENVVDYYDDTGANGVNRNDNLDTDLDMYQNSYQVLHM